MVSVVKGKQVNGEDLLEDGKYYMMNGGTEPSGYLDEYNTPANTRVDMYSIIPSLFGAAVIAIR